MNVTGKRLFGSADNLQAVRYYDDDTLKSKSNSREEDLNEEERDGENNQSQSANKSSSGRKLAREQMWRNLSQPKHPKTSIKQLREKIESDIKKESWSKSDNLQRVQTLPHLAPESRGLIASAEKWDKNNRSNNKSAYLTVPNVIQASKSDENLAARHHHQQQQPMAFETQDLMKSGSSSSSSRGPSPDFGGSDGSVPQRRRAKSLVITSGERNHPSHLSGGHHPIDLRLLLPTESTDIRQRSGSDSRKEINLIVPKLKIDTSD